MPDPKLSLLLYSNTGGGHRAAALAIREALESGYPGRYRVELLDALSEYAPRPLSYAPQFYPELTNFPRMWRFGYRLIDGRRRARVLSAALLPYVRPPAPCSHPESSRCILPAEAARSSALRHGLSEERLRVTGLPVSRGFFPASRGQAARRRKLGWPAGRAGGLRVGGGGGVGG